ncbi:MAG: aldose 1-epimerase family protein [Actinomycetota bacterium]|nr:aldose 1-epimerase family protein [Actinomycetota bacterium]
MPTLLPTGQQFDITAGTQKASVVELGAGLRSYQVDGRDIIDGYGEDVMPSGGRGQLLAPWPNRVGDGRYRFDDDEHQLALNELPDGHAIHGLLRWVPWRAVEVASTAVTFRQVILAQPGYPWMVEVMVTWSINEEGLRCHCQALNVGTKVAPWGMGAHPYLRVGDQVDEAMLGLDASTCYDNDDRHLPIGRRPTAGTPVDFTSPRLIGGAVLDECYTDLGRNPAGWAEATITGGGRQVRLICDQAFGYLMVFTGDTLALEQRRRGLAVEPMSCAPDAFRSGDGLIRLVPGESWQGTWGIQAARL